MVAIRTIQILVILLLRVELFVLILKFKRVQMILMLMVQVLVADIMAQLVQHLVLY